MLNIVDENDEVVGEASREDIHRRGLLHREIHVYFITPDKEIIFQRRAKDKDTFPNMLDATVGGHVEIGHSYEKTAVKETEEETGLKIDAADLIPLAKVQSGSTNESIDDSTDERTGKINNSIKQEYAYIFKGNIKDLKIEKGSGLGFEIYPINKIVGLSDADSAEFIPYILKFCRTELLKFVNNWQF